MSSISPFLRLTLPFSTERETFDYSQNQVSFQTVTSSLDELKSKSEMRTCDFCCTIFQHNHLLALSPPSRLKKVVPCTLREATKDLTDHSVRCMHAVIQKFTTIPFGISKKSKVFDVRCQKLSPKCKS